MKIELPKIFFPLLLASFAIVLCIANYKTGTWLSGWDTLHPEMNFSIYWERVLQSVWQDHQGLGAVATQAHASEIPRVLYMQALDIFFPTHFLRWAYFFTMLIIGPLGIYYLLTHLFKGKNNYKYAAFIGGLFYLLNLGTLQTFFAPLEMFATLYGFIGWIFLTALLFLKNPSPKTFLLYTVVTFFSMPMSHTPTLWFVNFMMLSVFALMFFLLEKGINKQSRLKRVTVLIVTTLILNSYWLLPTLYFTANHADEVANAKITSLVSDEGILNNLEYANIQNIAVLKGYLFNWKVHVGNESFNSIFVEWNAFYFRTFAIVIGYLFFALSIGGIIFTSLKKSSNSQVKYFLPIIFLSVFFLLMTSPPLGFLFGFMQNRLPLIKEALRFPYTKFSIPLMLSLSVFVGFFFLNFLEKIKIDKINLILKIIPVILLTYYFIPAFRGFLIGDIVKVKIPDSYFQVFDELNKEEGRRVATAPPNSIFGWVYYDWIRDNEVDASYQGAGFIWFLSKNPVLDREFDRWFPTNEDFYNEYQYAYYTNNIEQIKFVFEKYGVTEIMFDDSVISPGSPNSVNSQKMKELVSEDFEFVLLTEKDNLSVYTYVKKYPTRQYENNLNSEVSNDIYAPQKYLITGESYKDSQVDPVYYKNSNVAHLYSLDSKLSEIDIEYPFADDSSIKLVNENSLEIPYNENFIGENLQIQFGFNDFGRWPLKVNLFQGVLTLEDVIPVITDSSGQDLRLYGDGQTKKTSTSVPSGIGVVINGKKLREKETIILTSNSYPNFVFYNETPVAEYPFSNSVASAEPTDCFGGDGSFGKSIGKYPGSVVLSSYDRNICLKFDDGFALTRGDIVSTHFEYMTTSGGKAIYCIENVVTGECANEKYKNAPAKSEKYKTYEDYVEVFKTGEYRLVLINESSDKNETQNVEYKNIEVKKYRATGSTGFGSNHDTSPYTIQINNSQFPVKITFPEIEKYSKVFRPNLYDFNSDSRNCDLYNEEEFARELDPITGNFRYRAIDAISCDNLDLSEVDLSSGALVQITNQNISGKGLDVCLYSERIQKCLFTERLLTGTHAIVVPPYNDVEPLNLRISNHSIGKVPSENILSDLTFTPIPYSFIKGLTIMTKEHKYVDNSYAITNVVKSGKTRYKVEGSSSKPGKAVLVLNQSFEDGWNLYEADSCWFGITTPFTCRRVFTEHFVANNWANSWIFVPVSTSYVILYVPQYLQYIGYWLILSLFTISGVLWYKT